jgi:hypothetical protein
MPAILVPKKDIPKVAAQVDSPVILKVLRHLKDHEFIRNGSDVSRETADTLRRLTELRLVDPGYEATPAGRPLIWLSNANGERVLKHLESQHRYAVQITSRAHTALAALSEDERESVRAVLEWLVLRDQGEWPSDLAVRIGQNEPVYLVRATPELRAFIRVTDGGQVELHDIVSEDTFRVFLERYRAGSKTE